MTSVYVGGGVTFDGTEDLTASLRPVRGPRQGDRPLHHPGVRADRPGPRPAVPGLRQHVNNGRLADRSPARATAPVSAASSRGARSRTRTPARHASLSRVACKDLNDAGERLHGRRTRPRSQPSSSPAAPTRVPANLTEDISNSRYAIDSLDTAAYDAATRQAYPGDVSRTKPNRADGYTYMKAPRWNGLACEVGPMARIVRRRLLPGQRALCATSLGAYYTAYVKTVEAATPVSIPRWSAPTSPSRSSRPAWRPFATRPLPPPRAADHDGLHVRHDRGQPGCS